jgi:hypothetical protein
VAGERRDADRASAPLRRSWLVNARCVRPRSYVLTATLVERYEQAYQNFKEVDS